jgi:hypothetical protein
MTRSVFAFGPSTIQRLVDTAGHKALIVDGGWCLIRQPIQPHTQKYQKAVLWWVQFLSKATASSHMNQQNMLLKER